MKTWALLHCVLAILITGSPLLFAQDATGTWQGTLIAGKDNLRTMVKIPSDDGKLTGMFYSIDQDPDPIAVSSISVIGNTLKYSIVLLNGSFAGKFSADGNSIVGAWTQGGKPLPLTLVRANKDSAWDIPKPVTKMARNADPGFEVATIKPTKPGADNEEDDYGIDGRNITTRGTSLVDLIDFAYNLHRNQISAAPEWAASDLYDIAGVPDQPGEPNDKQMRSMIRKLLADRFQLKFHLEKKVLSIYSLTVGKNGLKGVTRSADQEGTLNIDMDPMRGGLKMLAQNSTMADFAIFGLEADVLDRPIQDNTGQSLRYDFTLTWLPDDSQFRGKMHFKAGKNPQPNLFTALQEQLGLKLDAIKAPVDVTVIDHVEHPSAN